MYGPMFRILRPKAIRCNLNSWSGTVDTNCKANLVSIDDQLPKFLYSTIPAKAISDKQQKNVASTFSSKTIKHLKFSTLLLGQWSNVQLAMPREYR